MEAERAVGRLQNSRGERMVAWTKKEAVEMETSAWMSDTFGRKGKYLERGKPSG